MKLELDASLKLSG